MVYVNQGHPLSSDGPVIDLTRLKNYMNTRGTDDEHYYVPGQPVIDFIEDYLHQPVSPDHWQQALRDPAATVVYLD